MGKKYKKELTKRTEEYNKYINSPQWRSFRLRIIKERGRKCETCGETEGEIHAHHKTYARFMNELPEDIKLLCKPCHEKLHRDANKRKRERSKRGEKSKPKKSKQKKSKKSILPKITASQKALQDRYNALGIKPMLKKIDIRVKKQPFALNSENLTKL